MNEPSLIRVLLDQTARLDERDDAAMDLGSSTTPEAFIALAKVASNPEEDAIVSASCGESIAERWVRSDSFDYGIWSQLAPPAKDEARELIRQKRPEWLDDVGELRPRSNVGE